MPGSDFVKKKCYNSSKKQISTISNTEWKWRAKIVDHKIILFSFCSEFPIH